MVGLPRWHRLLNISQCIYGWVRGSNGQRLSCQNYRALFDSGLLSFWLGFSEILGSETLQLV